MVEHNTLFIGPQVSDSERFLARIMQEAEHTPSEVYMMGDQSIGYALNSSGITHTMFCCSTFAPTSRQDSGDGSVGMSLARLIAQLDRGRVAIGCATSALSAVTLLQPIFTAQLRQRTLCLALSCSAFNISVSFFPFPYPLSFLLFNLTYIVISVYLPIPFN